MFNSDVLATLALNFKQQSQKQNSNKITSFDENKINEINKHKTHFNRILKGNMF